MFIVFLNQGRWALKTEGFEVDGVENEKSAHEAV